MMTEDEIRYVCRVIPSEDVVNYFRCNPKEFAKICPGFRASAIHKLDICNLLSRNRSRGFVNFFIEKHISDWLSQIQQYIEECLGNGDTRMIALLKALPYCYFVDNIGLYFKLIGEEYTEEMLSILGSSIQVIKDSNAECERLQKSLNDKTSALIRTEAEFDQVQSEKSKARKKLVEQSEEINTLKRANIDLEKSKTVIPMLEQTIVSFKELAHEQKDYIQQLEADLCSAKDAHFQFEQKIREEHVEQQEAEKFKKDAAQKPKCSKDLDDFKDYLGYNFIGNYNETTLITICDSHKDKIIFLTVSYERTLAYVSGELMRYFHYLNLNRIEAFIGNKDLTEDPSVLDEEEALTVTFKSDTRWSAVLKEILGEFEIGGAVREYKGSLVTNERSLCRLLAFDVLPYCLDVLKIAPFNFSERLVKYAGDSGRCTFKNLFRRWFA
jgi:hypothetical protein